MRAFAHAIAIVLEEKKEKFVFYGFLACVEWQATAIVLEKKLIL